MIFYKITQSKNSLSKEGETLYYAKTIITGKTDFNELCDKVNKLSKIDKRVVSEVLTYAWQVMKIEMAHGKAIENVDKTCCYIQITSKAKKIKTMLILKNIPNGRLSLNPVLR